MRPNSRIYYDTPDKHHLDIYQRLTATMKWPTPPSHRDGHAGQKKPHRAKDGKLKGGEKAYSQNEGADIARIRAKIRHRLQFVVIQLSARQTQMWSGQRRDGKSTLVRWRESVLTFQLGGAVGKTVLQEMSVICYGSGPCEERHSSEAGMHHSMEPFITHRTH